MYLINMLKRVFLDNRGRRKILPSGFHLVEDLVPLYQMRDNLKRNHLSKEAKLRLQWMDYYQKTKNISLTCRHFGISRQLFYYWKRRYNPYNLSSLESKERAPKKRRQREITPEQEMRIVALRKHYIRYGKEKIAKIYEQIYGEKISSWKIQKVIEKHKLYYLPQKTAKIVRKRKRALKKKRITEPKKETKDRIPYLFRCHCHFLEWSKEIHLYSHRLLLQDSLSLYVQVKKLLKCSRFP